MFAFTGADIYGPISSAQGHDVFEPIGFDAFGIHSEKLRAPGGHPPGKLIPKNIETFRRQLRRFGGMFDWRHELSTTDPGYYKWTQWIFVAALQGGAGVPQEGGGELVPQGHERRRERAGDQRLLRAPSRHQG